MDGLISPLLLYAACVVGAAGIWLALPRRKPGPRTLGVIIAAGGAGLVVFSATLAAMLRPGSAIEVLPNINFYIFSLISVVGAIKVVTQPRPVYAALYFILTVLSSAGLFVLLSAEFMAAALVIVYAGAILITYLFVIMLATEAPTADEVESLADYDRSAREPGMASALGFVLVAALTTMFGAGGGSLIAAGRPGEGGAGGGGPDDAVLAMLPGKVETVLRRAGVIDADAVVATDASGSPMIDMEAGTITVRYGGVERVIPRSAWPDTLRVTNVEGVGFELLGAKPGAIEMAGVILLMAMLGAVVLARKKVELDERARAARAGEGDAI